MTVFIVGFAVGFGCGGALVWFYKSKIAAGVVATNAAVVEVKAAVAPVVDAAKKL